MLEFLHLNKQVILYDQDDLQLEYLQPKKKIKKKIKFCVAFNDQVVMKTKKKQKNLLRTVEHKLNAAVKHFSINIINTPMYNIPLQHLFYQN